jgi:sulfide:quinone oxidoreductase
VIAGGGVAALEAMIGVRELLDGFVSVDLITPTGEFVYRPLVVAEPFGLAERRVFDLARIAADHSAHLHLGRLEALDADRSVATLTGGETVDYDAMVVAVGAQPTSWLAGGTHFRGPEDVDGMRELVSELDAGVVGRVVFTCPPVATWTLPMYELALLTSSYLSEHRRGEAQLTIVTPEESPLAMFGPAAAEHVRGLCADRGIRLRTATRARSFARGRLELDPDGSVEADRVVVLPELKGRPVAGLPHDADGFIPVDEHCAVVGLAGVYAAGDGISYPIKQGGLATQQADAAARAIAAGLGASIEPEPFAPRLRGQLLTGLGPTYLRAGPGQDPQDSVAFNPLWWPPSKIAGRYLAPYLARHAMGFGARELEEREPSSSTDEEAREEARKLALTFAEHDARHGDYKSALGWLDTLEQIDGLLPAALVTKRAAWRAELA